MAWDGSAQAALRQLGVPTAPVLLRLPISHYCRKVEWGLTHAGVPYQVLDVRLRHMREARRANPIEKTVPVLATPDGVLHGSHAILRWAEVHRAPGAPSLYPAPVADAVVAWEADMDRDVGHVVRREAYRALVETPHAYARTWMDRVRMRLARPMFHRVMQFYAMDRYHDDPRILREAITRVVARLREHDGGFLFAPHATAADVATAALLQPLVALAEVRGYGTVPGWGEFVQYVRTVKPARTTRIARRRITEADWQAFETLNRKQVELARPEGAAALVSAP